MEKRCENCRKLMTPRLMSNGKPEYPSYFKKKRFCGPICSGVFNEGVKKIAKDAEMRA